jgi:methylmalonyl-CoA/ethylmalonyl-CoA epimerase
MSPIPTKIDHIAIAVRSIEETARFYTEGLGLTLSTIEEVPDQKVRAAFLQVGEVKLELVEPMSPDAPISKFLEQRGQGLHHVCYAVADIDATLTELKGKGLRLLDETPRIGAHGARIAFLHPKSSDGVLTELSQPGHDL